jgi:hypothetical protein
MSGPKNKSSWNSGQNHCKSNLKREEVENGKESFKKMQRLNPEHIQPEIRVQNDVVSRDFTVFSVVNCSLVVSASALWDTLITSVSRSILVHSTKSPCPKMLRSGLQCARKSPARLVRSLFLFNSYIDTNVKTDTHKRQGLI